MKLPFATALLSLFLLLFTPALFAQEEEFGDGSADWPALSPIDEGGLAVYSQESFLVALGAAVVSYGLAEFLFKDENLHYYHVHAGVYGAENGMRVFMENVGIEKRLAPWFGMSAEIINQQWTDGNYKGMGMGITGYWRWYLLGNKRFSPFIETGTGGFMGFRKFPEGGTNFTFHLSTALGLEYTRPSGDKFRGTYGHIHQSNNDLFGPNPGMQGNGFTFSYLWVWGK